MSLGETGALSLHYLLITRPLTYGSIPRLWEKLAFPWWGGRSRGQVELGAQGVSDGISLSLRHTKDQLQRNQHTPLTHTDTHAHTHFPDHICDLYRL